MWVKYSKFYIMFRIIFGKYRIHKIYLYTYKPSWFQSIYVQQQKILKIHIIIHWTHSILKQLKLKHQTSNACCLFYSFHKCISRHIHVYLMLYRNILKAFIIQNTRNKEKNESIFSCKTFSNWVFVFVPINIFEKFKELEKILCLGFSFLFLFSIEQKN